MSLFHKSVLAGAALMGLSWTSSVFAVALVNTSFDSALTTTSNTSVTATDAGAWVMNNNSWSTASVSGQQAATRSSNFTRYLVQVVQDDNTSKGEHTFSFDYYSYDTNNDNTITPQIYGTNSDTFSLGITGGGTTELTELFVNYSVTNAIKNGDGEPPKTVNWTNYSTTVDLGETGYKWIVVRLIGTEYNTSGTHSDVIAIDNVSLIPEPGTIALTALGAGLVLFRREGA